MAISFLWILTNFKNYSWTLFANMEDAAMATSPVEASQLAYSLIEENEAANSQQVGS